MATEEFPLWEPNPERKKNSNMQQFMNYVNRRYGYDFRTYEELWNWSITFIDNFWESIWNYAQIIYSEKYSKVTVSDPMRFHKIPRPTWFPGAKLNFAENLLRFQDNHRAIVHWREDLEPIYITYEQLYEQVAKLAYTFRKLGVKAGDRIAGFVTNVPEAIISMLAATSLGAVWTSCSPDFGFQGILDRFGQTEPKILIAVNGYSYNGKIFDCNEKLQQIIQNIPAIEKVILIKKVDCTLLEGEKILHWENCLDNPAKEILFEQLPFDHPLYIMYSSGTTGIPKCIVHGAGGTLLQHWKELALHSNLQRDDIISFYTTCGWMMWNWLVSSLSVGATVFLYDGSPSYPTMNILWEAAEQEKITIMGTSPKYLTACQKEEITPFFDFDLTNLHTMLSTGSPLIRENFEYVYMQVKRDIQLSSISGGTDIISCFMLGNPLLPVYPEEIQCRGLGMSVQAFNHNGAILVEESGELVCTKYFPSMPIYFWNDKKDEKYHSAYFDTYNGIWRHGDFIKVTKRGSVIVYGRSDATLNPGGVRIGTAEIYNSVESIEEILDSIVVGQRVNGDVRIILFVVLKDLVTLDDDLISIIKSQIKQDNTPRHIPAVIRQIDEVPVTINGKKVELAVTQIIHGEKVENMASIANPDSLNQFKNIKL